MPGGEPVTTWVVSPHRLVAQAVTSALASVGVDVEMHAWDSVVSGTGSEDHGQVNRPVVVVLDEEAPAPAFDGIQRLVGRADLRVAVVVPARGTPWWGELLDDPAIDLILTASTLRELVEAVERFAAGERILSPDSRREVQRAWTEALDKHLDAVALVRTLSPQQRRVLELLAAGRHPREIAQMIGVADGTVRSHVRTLRAKLGARTQIEAVAMLRQVETPVVVVPRPRPASDQH